MVNPFKKEHNEHNEHNEHDLGKDGSTKEITIKINPTKMLKYFLILLVLIAVFYAGRFSVDSSSLKYFTGSTDAVVIDKEVEEVTSEVVENSTEDTVEPVKEEVKVTEPDPVPEEEKEEKEEIVEVAATSYDKVTLSIDEPYIDWKTTWGKVTGLKITINNKETGFINPDRAVMLMEGYDDSEKDVVFLAKSSKIKAGENHQTDVTVSGGFSYHPNSAGDLEKVKVTLIIYDSEDEVIASKMQELNLKGE